MEARLEDLALLAPHDQSAPSYLHPFFLVQNLHKRSPICEARKGKALRAWLHGVVYGTEAIKSLVRHFLRGSR